jgi:hypothetical protein
MLSDNRECRIGGSGGGRLVMSIAKERVIDQSIVARFFELEKKTRSYRLVWCEDSSVE